LKNNSKENCETQKNEDGPEIGKCRLAAAASRKKKIEVHTGKNMLETLKIKHTKNHNKSGGAPFLGRYVSW